MGKSKSKLFFGLFFIALAILSIVSLTRTGFQSYLLIGTLLFALIGIGFLRRSDEK
jgi:hypothetical protein